MRAFSISSVLLVIAALILSYFLVPNRQDIALMELRAKKHERARKFYQKEYEKGSRSTDVLVALSNLSEVKGDIKTAIKHMLEYLEKNPNDVQALRRIGTLFLLNQQYDEYFKILIKLQKMKEDPYVLKELSKWYKEGKSPEKLFTTLEKLVISGKATEEDYLVLSYLYAAKKDYKKALSLLHTRRNFFDKDVTINDIFFELWLNLEIGKSLKDKTELIQEQSQLLASFLEETDDPKLVNFTLTIVGNYYSQLLPSLLYLLQPIIEENPELQIGVLQIMYERSPNRNEDFQKLLELFRKNPENIGLQNFIFSIYLLKGDLKNLRIFLNEINVQNLEDDSIIRLCLLSMEKDKKAILKDLEKLFGNEFLKNHPVIFISLDIAMKKDGARNKLAKIIETRDLTRGELISFIQIAGVAKYRDETLLIGNKIKNYKGLEDYDLLAIAVAYSNIKEEKIFADRLEKEMPVIGEKNAAPALVLLDLSLGKTKSAANRIYEQHMIQDYIFDDLFARAVKKREYTLALYIAKKQFNTYPSIKSEINYALSLVMVGRVENGLLIFKKIYAKTPKDPIVYQSYLEALIFLAKRNPAYHKDLETLMMNLKKQKLLTKDLQRYFAYVYLDVFNDFEKAEKIFKNLAGGFFPNSQEVQNLVYIWGPKPDLKNANWLEDQARKSKAKNLGYWLNYLNFIGRYDAVIDIFQKRDEENLDIRAYFAYMDALSYKKEKKMLKNAIDVAFFKIESFKQYRRLSAYAGEAEYNQVNTRIWLQATSKWPKDPITWQNLAAISFYEHDYDTAQFALEKFFTLCNPNFEKCSKYNDLKKCFISLCFKNSRLPESLYEYGDVLYRKFRYHEAKLYYLLALELIQNSKSRSFYMYELEALLYKKINKSKSSLYFTYKLYERSSRNLNMAALYANRLMDQGFLFKAKKFLEKAEFYKNNRCSKILEKSPKGKYEE